jgi:hypothetical protein
MEALLLGSKLLDLKVKNMYDNLRNKMPLSPRPRQSFEAELSRKSMAMVGDHSKAAQKDQEATKRKNTFGDGRLESPTTGTSEVSLMAKVSDLI